MVPGVLRLPDFRLYWAGIALAQMGTRATLAANLWQMLEITGSTLQVGLIGLFEAVSLLLVAPLGGAIADRVERRRLLQATQAITLAAAGWLAILTLSGAIQPWHIYLAVFATSAANTFDGPARQALIPALVPEERLTDAVALAIPAREFALLAGPALAGLVLAAFGPGPVYLLGVGMSALLILLLAILRVRPVEGWARPVSLLSSIGEGFRYVRGRPLIWQLMSLDFSMSFFGAYRVLLPALARDVLQVGASGYGLLLAAPAAGAILGSAASYGVRRITSRGLLILGATMAYAGCAMGLAQAPVFALALLAAGGIGFFDAVSTTLRQVAVQLDTPDRLRGRVISVFRMASSGGPSLGQAYMGALATGLGPPLALTLSALVPLAYAGWLAATGRTVRRYAA